MPEWLQAHTAAEQAQLAAARSQLEAGLAAARTQIAAARESLQGLLLLTPCGSISCSSETCNHIARQHMRRLFAANTRLQVLHLPVWI